MNLRESKLHCQNIAVNARDVNIIQQLLPLQQQKHMIVLIGSHVKRMKLQWSVETMA